MFVHCQFNYDRRTVRLQLQNLHKNLIRIVNTKLNNKTKELGPIYIDSSVDSILYTIYFYVIAKNANFLSFPDVCNIHPSFIAIIKLFVCSNRKKSLEIHRWRIAVPSFVIVSKVRRENLSRLHLLCPPHKTAKIVLACILHHISVTQNTSFAKTHILSRLCNIIVM